MVDQWKEHCDFTYSTDAEIDQDSATWDGYKWKDKAWLLSPRDVWYPNPHYVGKPVPHPESYEEEQTMDLWKVYQQAKLWIADIVTFILLMALCYGIIIILYAFFDVPMYN